MQLKRKSSLNLEQRLSDHIVLPIVTILLVIGAVFVALAWAEARHSIDTSARFDAERAARNATAVSKEFSVRQDALRMWLTEHDVQIDDPIGSNEARSLLDSVQSSGGWRSTDLLAYAVMRLDGSLVGMAETNPGALVDSGVDDVRVFARKVSARNQALVSDKIMVDGRAAYVVGVPIASTKIAEQAGAGPVSGALVGVYSVENGPLESFFPSNPKGKLEVLSLRDGRNRLVSGFDKGRSNAGMLVRKIHDSSWYLKLGRERVKTFLPVWTYPLFSLLLLMLAVGYVWQEVTRRRSVKLSEMRTRQVRILYGLSSAMLHSAEQKEQAVQLCLSVRELVDLDVVSVKLSGADEYVVEDGELVSGMNKYQIPIMGTNNTLGNLFVARMTLTFDEDERNLVRTAAALAGAAMQTAANLELERSTAAELQHLDDLRSNLLATVAHELRSPVTAIKGVLDLLSMQDDLSERSTSYVEVASTRTNRLVSLIQDLFDCSLLETGQLDIKVQRQNAKQLLNAALGAQAAAKPAELMLRVDDELDITVDPVRFDQLVNNLVTNAFRHGKAPVVVEILSADDGVEIVVTDQGQGISVEDRERIFGKFWQGSSGHARLVEGAGIGLSLVQGLVALHGGRIDIDYVNHDSTGTRFGIWLPN